MLARSNGEVQVKAFRLMVNRSVTWADWDEDLLALELRELNEAEFDLTLTGFEDEELARLLGAQDAGGGFTDEYDAPAPPEVPVTRPNDLWLLGAAGGSRSGRGMHRVLCADSTSSDNVSRLLCAQTGIPQRFLCVTDAPYGVGLEPEWRVEAGLQGRSVQSGKVRNDDRIDWSAAYALFPGNVLYA